MSTNLEVTKIKTEISEGSRGDNHEDHHRQTHGSIYHPPVQTYQCQLCSRHRIVCPCTAHPRPRNEPYTFHKKKNGQSNEKRFMNQSMDHSSKSVPKIIFTYAQRPKNHSFSIPKAHPAPISRIIHQTTTTVIPPRQEILYYPVIHNLFKPATPNRDKHEDNGHINGSMSRRRTKRSFVNQSIKLMKEVSTDQSKDPMTPQQFRKFAEWLQEN